MPRSTSLPALLLLTTAAFAQTAPTVEVASVKIHAPGTPSPPTNFNGNTLTVGGNLKQLIMYAYDLKVYQLAGAGPTWVDHPALETDYFDITAQAAGEQPLTTARARQLLQAVLTTRFQLAVHRETKEQPVYALVVGKSGPKFKPSAADAITQNRGRVTETTVASTFTNSPIDALVRILASTAGRPVLDRTNLTGLYDFNLEFARDPAAAVNESNASSVFTALQEQLGLKLDAQKAPIEVLVLDHAERPSAN